MTVMMDTKSPLNTMSSVPSVTCMNRVPSSTVGILTSALMERMDVRDIPTVMTRIRFSVVVRHRGTTAVHVQLAIITLAIGANPFIVILGSSSTKKEIIVSTLMNAPVA